MSEKYFKSCFLLNSMVSLILFRSLPYTDAVIHETIRINSIAPISQVHVATETTQFCGYTIPKVNTLNTLYELCL